MQFQNIIGKQLGQVAITTAYTTAYLTPNNVRVYIKDFDICNTTSLVIRAYVHLVPAISVSGIPVIGTASTANALMYSVTIPAYSVVQWAGSQIMDTAGSVQVKASAVGCTITISGGEAS